jgi:glyoxylase I family protein
MNEERPPPPVHHVAVLTSDLSRAEAFYGALLGLPVLRRHEDASGAPRSIWFELGRGAFLAVEKAEREASGSKPSAPGWHCVVLGIDRAERAALRERLAQGGHPVERETAYTLYARDPDGSWIGLSHYPEAAD